MKRFPNYTQLDSADCGPTCLRIISKYYGRSFTVQSLREKAFITRAGVSLLGISDAAEQIGFRTSGVKLTFLQLAESVKLPCILHWNQNHFVVCYGVSKDRKGQWRVRISDPVGEKYTMNREEFMECWTGKQTEEEKLGMALLLEPTPDFYSYADSDPEQEKGLKHFFGYVRPYRRQVIQLILGMVAASVLALILPFLTQAMVDQGIGNNNLNFVTLVLIAQLILSVTQIAVTFIQNRIVLHVNSRISIALISDFLAKLMRLHLRFFDSKNIGDIIQRIGDNTRIRSFLTGTTLTTLFSFANFLIFALVLAWYNTLILAVFLLGNAIYVGWIFLFLKYRRKLDALRFTQAAAEQSSLIQIVTGMQEIKLNNCEKQERWRWERIQIKLFHISLRGLSVEQYQQVGSVFFSQTTSLLVSFIAARSVIEGDITLGMMMSVSYIIGQLSAPISQLITFVQNLQDARISLERLNEIHHRTDEEQEMHTKVSQLPEQRDLVLQDVCFSYDGAERDYVLDHLDLQIPQHKITAIVGASGSGKTTLVKLLLGFYPPVKGEVKIGDGHLSDINPHLWRSVCGAVLQDGFIFSDTIARNIAVGEERVDMRKLFHAVDVANIREFIESLPLKYETKIGMEGGGVSQGQRQRILIARAVYKNPEFLFFDEATNALDANNERVILEKLNSFYKGKTVVIVAHRLSTVQHADKIVVLDKGRILEEGNHEDLIARKGAYYELIRNQLELGQ